ncbi:hypothetical protein RQ765_05175 [Roseomonas mucosa]|uniref:hypothetical protein n=1 Tax=Roseomonas mucosa TaxID=207340 RepID=UPI0028CD3C11|nr:hypothetical protein [Roseomonas mucosa]MDT8313987.1 hypothetical protein [Roseomonas mucosa]MDT8359717.1 hypothetical protein [Roseomonas mucosa]
MRSMAICISGQARRWESCATRLLELFPDAQFFVSLWERRGIKRFGALNQGQLIRLFGPDAAFILNPDFQNEFLLQRVPALKDVLLKEDEKAGMVTSSEVMALIPNSICRIQKDSVLDCPPALRDEISDGGHTAASDGNSVRTVWNWWQCDLLRRQEEYLRGKLFDLVLRVRPDLWIEHINLPADVPPNVVCVPNLRNGAVDDQFAIANSETMSSWCDGPSFLRPYFGRQNNWRNIHLALGNYANNAGIKLTRAPWKGRLNEDYLPISTLRAAAENSLQLLPEALRPETGVLALCLRSLEEADELKSENYLKEAETLNPISPSIYLTRALLYRRQKDERSFREAVGAAASRFSDKLHLRSDIQAILNA